MLTPGIIGIIVTLVVVGLALYLIDLIPMDRTIKQIIRGIIIVLAIVWLLQAFGFMGSVHSYFHPVHPAR